MAPFCLAKIDQIESPLRGIFGCCISVMYDGLLIHCITSSLTMVFVGTWSVGNSVITSGRFFEPEKRFDLRKSWHYYLHYPVFQLFAKHPSLFSFRISHSNSQMLSSVLQNNYLRLVDRKSCKNVRMDEVAGSGGAPVTPPNAMSQVYLSPNLYTS